VVFFLRSVLVHATVPQRHIPGYRDRGRECGRECGRGQKLFLSYSGRPSCATLPGARCVRWGLRRGLYFLRSILARAVGPQRHTPASLQRESTRGIVAGGKNYLCLTAAARAAPRPQGHARCVRWGLRRFFLAVRFSPGYRALGPGCVALARPRCRGGWMRQRGFGLGRISP
jgi:hypothetical protein